MTFEFTIGGKVAKLDLDDAQRFFGRTVSLISGGYLAIKIGKKRALLHRVVLGLTPCDTQEADHINGDRLDNRKANLRSATKSQNGANKKARADSSSGITGVWWDAKRERWCAGICADKKRIALGRFVRKEDAIAARHAAEDKHQGVFAARHGAQRGN